MNEPLDRIAGESDAAYLARAVNAGATIPAGTYVIRPASA